jgi:colanic acid/amylovoran biosynthesis glycosyltransferase
MKIAFVLHKFPKLPQTFIMNQITGLMDRGHEIHIFSERVPEQNKDHEAVEEYSLHENITYFEAPGSYTEAARKTPYPLVKQLLKGRFDVLKFVQTPRKFPKKIRSLDKFSSEEEFDILHFHFGPMAKEHLHLTEETGAKTLASFYGSDVTSYPKNNQDVYNEVFQKVDEIIALSDHMQKNLQDLGAEKEKINKVPLCIDIDKFSPKKKENKDPKILTVSRFVEKKGLKYAVNALSQIEQEFEYHMVGDGELREQIEKQVKEQGLEDQVTFHGWMTNEEVKQKMQESDIFLLPSVTASDGDQEGTPTVLLEAQATGLPVASTYHAGIPEIVEDGETGLLAEEKDVEDLKQNLESLIDDVEKRKAMGAKGRTYIEENHSIEKISQKLEQLYAR